MKIIYTTAAAGSVFLGIYMFTNILAVCIVNNLLSTESQLIRIVSWANPPRYSTHRVRDLVQVPRPWISPLYSIYTRRA